MSTFDEEKFNMEVRKFLKKVGVTSQREIEQAVREALQAGKLKGAPIKTKMTLEVAELGLSFEIDGEIALR
jgi:predicted nucleotide-binding protein (sugar kinase/HSP70/actin superfamily)